MATVDKAVGDLPQATEFTDDALLVMEQGGEAFSVTGAMVKKHAALESGSGKRTCRIVIGTSHSSGGWTAADCDYLCDGTNDAEIIDKALAAVPSTYGAEVILLSGNYYLNGATVTLGVAQTKLSGNGRATQLHKGHVEITKQYCELSNLVIDGDSVGGVGVTLSSLYATVTGCFIDQYDTGILRSEDATGTGRDLIAQNHFDNCGVCISYLQGGYGARIIGNILECSSSGSFVALEMGGCCEVIVSGNSLLGNLSVGSDAEWNIITGNIVGGNVTIAGNCTMFCSNIVSSDEFTITGDRCTVNGNDFAGGSVTIEGGINAFTGNLFESSNIIIVTGQSNTIGLNSRVSSLEVSGKNNRVDPGTLVTALPTASSQLRGQTLLLSGETSDTLYVCMLVDGTYQWVAK